MLAWLFARSAGARFLVRMEDLDPERSKPELEVEQLADLRALGLDWDGPVVRQSERGVLYADATRALDAEGLLYECYCTRREIREAASAPNVAALEGAYPGTCRTLIRARRDELRAAGRRPALRLRADVGRLAFVDRLLGPRESVIDDLVVRRRDGVAAYNLAVVVDDAEQGIGEVVRGDDLAETTPRQLLLARRLGLPEPTYAHGPLVLGPTGRRLAKRDGAVNLADRAALGESPAMVLARLAETLGLAEPAEEVTPARLLARFRPDTLPSEPTMLAPQDVVGRS